MCFPRLLHSPQDRWILLQRSFLIRTRTGQRSFGSSPCSFVAYTVLHRQYVPRHPPRALSRLSFKNSRLISYDLRLDTSECFLLFAYSQMPEKNHFFSGTKRDHSCSQQNPIQVSLFTAQSFKLPPDGLSSLQLPESKTFPFDLLLGQPGRAWSAL